jgi:hypothetical protein
MALICPKFHGVALEKEKRLLLRLGCKQWQCPVCYKRNRELWRQHLMRKIGNLGGAWSFHTVTMPKFIHAASTPELRALWSIKRIRGHWDKFMKWMKRQFGKFQYVRVFETHESGALHIHFLASFHIAHDDYKTANKGKKNEYTYSAIIKKNAPKYGWGFMCSAINLPLDDFALTVGYATKYMTKEDDFVSKYLAKERVRRIQTSSKIGAVPKGKSDGNWEIGSGVNIYENQETPYFDINKGKRITDKDFEGEHWYPTNREVLDKKVL